MYKKIIFTLVGLLILCVGIFVIIIYTDFNQSEKTAVKDMSDTTVKKDHAKSVSKSKNDGSADKKDYTNPFGDAITQRGLDDKIIADYIHKMSHQKVSADAKWGFYQITDKRIKWLLDGLDKTEQTLSYDTLYETILSRWMDGDYSNVVNDHNELWEIQGGSIGKATGKLSAEQEKNYIEEHTRDD